MRVINRGFNTATGEWEQAEGKAFFVSEPTVGRLKVSFFGPFYGAYNIFALDQEDYRYAMVTGANRSYLWILARTPGFPENTLNRLAQTLRQQGYNPCDFITTPQTGGFDGQRPLCEITGNP